MRAHRPAPLRGAAVAFTLLLTACGGSEKDCGALKDVPTQLDSDDFRERCPFDALGTGDTAVEPCEATCYALAACLGDVNIAEVDECDLGEDAVRCTVREFECLNEG